MKSVGKWIAGILAVVLATVLAAAALYGLALWAGVEIQG